jgi:hypothetical protein
VAEIRRADSDLVVVVEKRRLKQVTIVNVFDALDQFPQVERG